MSALLADPYEGKNAVAWARLEAVTEYLGELGAAEEALQALLPLVIRTAQEQARSVRGAPARRQQSVRLNVQTVGTSERELEDRRVAWSTEEPQ